MQLNFFVNDAPVSLEVDPQRRLLDILREGTVWIAVDQLLTEQVPWEAYPKEGSFWIRY